MLTNISKDHVSLLQIESRDIDMSEKIEMIEKLSLYIWKIKIIYKIDNEIVNCKQILFNTVDIRKYTLNLNQFAKYRDHFHVSSGYTY